MKILIPVFALVFLLGSTSFYEPLKLPSPPPSDPWLHFQVVEPEQETESLPPRRLSEYSEFFELVAAEENIPVSILESVAFVESGFRPWAVSPERCDGNKDLGMFQFNSKYLEWFGMKYNGGEYFDPFDYEIAAVVAARYLLCLKERLGTWPLAVMAYNCGPSRVEADDIPESTYRHLVKVWN